MGKITRKNIINICSSYRPCPVRSNIEKSAFGQGVQTDRRPLGSPTVLPRCSLGSRQAFLSRFWPDPGSNSFFGPTGCSKRRGYPLSHGCLTRNPRTFRSGRWGSATPSGRQRDSCTAAEARTCMYYLGHFCGLACAKRVGIDWASRDVGQG